MVATEYDPADRTTARGAVTCRLVHKWTSLVCTAFLLLICVTGLPLLFAEEIDGWLSPGPPYPTLPAGTPNASLDRLTGLARELYPGEIITSMFLDDDEPRVVVSVAPSWRESVETRSSNHFVEFDARTAQVRDKSQAGEQRMDLLTVLFRLHIDLFADLPGNLLMAAMGVLLVVAIISGLVLYGRSMRKLPFGTIRHRRVARIRWLDLHNLLGVVTLAWVLVVGATGVMNELSRPLFALWQATDVEERLAPRRNQSPPGQDELASLQGAYDTARQAAPGMTITSVVFPGSDVGSPHDYLFWAKGATPLTGRLFSPVLVDARSGALTTVLAMPWYLRVLELSRPLHFGDYGGLPLRLLWALLDIVTIVVLISGLVLWIRPRASSAAPALAEDRPDDG